MSRVARRRSGGFTLIELVTALAVAAILMAMAAPDVRRMVRQHQLNAAVTDLYNAINLTRSQAIARGGRVLMAPAAPDGVDWGQGWVVFDDRDGDRRPGKDDDILATHGALADAVTVSSVFTNQKAPYYLAYNGAGRSCSDTSSLAARWGSLTIADAEQTRRIRINMLGRARICDPARDGASCAGTE